ncbi:MAG: transketolase [Peptostreptococcaceae bacterium]|nr:transketolase [Peptostreptococcaceae bacterium]
MAFKKLEDISNNIRISIIKAVHAAGSGHPGGSLSAADILTVLYFHEMKIDPKDPKMEDRDKFILSKGHAAPVLYSTLAEKGFFPKEELLTLRKLNSKIQGHPDMRKVIGVEMSTGSLGQGFSVAGGVAMANKMDGKSGRVYVLLGDGELQEGLVWEAAMSSAHYKLDNLVAIVDWNGLQIDGNNDDVMTVKPIDKKFESFGWNVISIDGHNIGQIIEALAQAREFKGKPTAIIAKTIKGKGVSFMENVAGWHGKAPNDEEAKMAVKELGGLW